MQFATSYVALVAMSKQIYLHRDHGEHQAIKKAYKNTEQVKRLSQPLWTVSAITTAWLVLYFVYT